ncbi:hypothetical protein SEA_MALIBO_33 [Gordonia phage Malibo]|nr:hypothetical protein SEA_MALIBO_33 [Gordonia phage Malibo]
MTYLTPFLPLIGVVAGGLLAYLFGIRNENTKWERSERTRTGEVRRKAYSEYARAIKRETVLCRKMASHLNLGPTGERLDPAVGLPELSATNRERSSLFEELLLVGDQEVVTTARTWQDSVWMLRKAIRGEVAPADHPFNDLYTACGVARDAFYAAARHDLGVPGSVSAMSPAPTSA